MLYLIANNSSLVSKQNLLTDSIFAALKGTEIKNVSFSDWKNAFTSQKIQTRSLDQDKPQKFYFVDQVQPSLGLFGGSVEVSGTCLAVSQKPGLVLTPDSTLTLSKSLFFVGFQPEEKFARFTVPGKATSYPESRDSFSYFINSDAEQDRKEARIHSPTFYFRFLLTSDSVFPMIFFMRGDIRQKNSIAVIFRRKTDDPNESFLVSIYARDAQNKIYQFDFPGELVTNRVHSLGVSYLRLLGLYSQLVITIDDGRSVHGSPLFSDCFIENSEQTGTFFPRDTALWRVFDQNESGQQSPGDPSRRGPGFGSLLLRFAHLNSGSALLHNPVFGHNPEFLSNCLGTCALNFSMDPLQNYNHSQTEEDVPTSFFWSQTCLSCNSVFPYFNWSSLGLSLRKPTFFPKKSDLVLSQNGSSAD